jgi:hypothetical protein
MYIDNSDSDSFIMSLWGGHHSFNKSTKTFSINRDCGLFSNITIAMYGILRLLRDGYKVENIELILNEYIDSTNIYNNLFNKKSNHLDLLDIFTLFTKEELDHCLIYGEPSYLGLGRTTRDFNTNIYHTIYKHYFNFNSDTFSIINNIEKNYNINYNNSIFIWARKTDKITETSIPELKTYIDLLISHNLYDTYTIYLQTDDISIAKESINYKNIILLDVLPFGKNPSTGFHVNLNKVSDDSFMNNYSMTKILYLKNLLSLVSIASRCKYSVIYPGNLATFIPIIKNTFNNCFCFKNNEELLS